MYRFNFLLILAVLVICHPASAAIPAQLTLLGSGEVRYLGLIRVYQASLYGSPEATRETILDPSTSRCLKLDYEVGLSVDNFVEAAETVLERQGLDLENSPVKAQIDLLHRHYRDVQEGDSYSLCYHAETGTTDLNLNGEQLVSVPSPDFATVYFGIWLAEQEPLSQSLRRQLLSGLKADQGN